MVIKLKPNERALDEALKGIKDNLEKKKQLLSDIFFSQTLPMQLQDQATVQMYFEAVMNVFLNWQGEYFDPSPIIGETDPTGFDYWRGAIRREVKTNLEAHSNALKGTVSPYNLVMTILSDEFLGIGEKLSPKDTSPIKWAKYFVEGPIHGSDVLIWITPEIHQELSPKDGSSLGRFGAGYLRRVKQGTDLSKLTATFEKIGYKLDDYIHPQTSLTARGSELAEAVASLPIESVIIKPAWEKAEEIFLKKSAKK